MVREEDVVILNMRNEEGLERDSAMWTERKGQEYIPG